jgi:thiamine kinase-like enzyme
MTVATKLLDGQMIRGIEEIKRGFSCKKYVITTESKTYVLRVGNDQKNALFAVEVKVTEIASNLRVGPTLFSYDLEQRQMLLQYVICQKWPPFEQDPSPYYNAMRLLKTFHSQSPGLMKHEDNGEFSPFSLLLNRGHKMITEASTLPKHFAQAIDKITLILQALTPWLKGHGTFCHGDFHKDNALYDGKEVFLIDWETTSWGDPLLDIVKFSLNLSVECRIQLYAAYLDHAPTPSEKAHFQLIDLTFLIVVAVNRIEPIPIITST